LKVLHLPTEIAGQVNLSVKGLRNIDIEAYNTARKNPFGYPVDIDPTFRGLPFLKNTRNPLLIGAWIKKYDVFHYHKSPYIPYGLDVKYLRKIAKPFFIEFWGSDIRLHDQEAKRNPYFEGDNSDNQKRKLRRLEFWSDNTDEVIMSDHSADNVLSRYFRKIHVVGQRVDTSLHPPRYPSPDTKIPRIVHAPSTKAIKGTIHVQRAIGNLKKRGVEFHYVEVSGVPHQKPMEIYAGADIVIDQLLLGSHGVFACEAMALGKPVVCYIMDELIGTYPEGFPIINANPDNLEEVLERLICNPEQRFETGRNSRAYAERVHDINVVARKLKAIYDTGFRSTRTQP
jgi:glycosyltransferase involved in cell wall biosynthesis